MAISSPGIGFTCANLNYAHFHERTKIDAGDRVLRKTDHVTDPWIFPDLIDYPTWPFRNSFHWHLGNLIHILGVKEKEFPSGAKFHRSAIANIRLRDAFLCSGILNTPSTHQSSHRVWAFLLEHLESLRPSAGRLRLVEDCKNWDERTRTIFSERFGVGLCGWLLWNSYEILHIADAGAFISEALNDPSSPYDRKALQSRKLYGKNGGLKPDFFCLTSSGECVIAESKGGLGPPSRLASAIKTGKEQVENVQPTGVRLRSEGGRLVFASNFRHAGEDPKPKGESCITVVDPKENFDPIVVPLNPDKIALHSYCKILAFCGRPELARFLLAGGSLDQPVQSDSVVEFQGKSVLPLSYAPNGLFGLEPEVAKVVFKNEEGLAPQLNEILIRVQGDNRIRSSTNSLVLPNGFTYIGYLD